MMRKEGKEVQGSAVIEPRRETGVKPRFDRTVLNPRYHLTVSVYNYYPCNIAKSQSNPVAGRLFT